MSSHAIAIRRLAVAGLSSFLVLVAALAAPSSTESTNTAPVAHTSVSSRSTGNLQHTAVATTLGVATAPTGLNAGLTVEPRVPRADGTPCEVTLFTNQGFGELFSGGEGNAFQYVPPSGCPGPWAKVILQLELSGPRSYASAFIRVAFGLPPDLGIPTPHTVLFQGAPQEHEGLPVWRIERDLTEYATLLRTPRSGYTGANFDNISVIEEPAELTGTARLKFFPATVQTPAPRIAHAVYPVNQPLTLPRNIVRAYVDVIAQGAGNNRFWYSCVPTASLTAFPALRTPFGIGDDLGGIFGPPDQGCGGGSFRHVEVLIDGQPAGIAQVYPWLPSLIHRHGRIQIDLPAPSVQALNFMPYRVDVTPFAALLSDGAEHTVEVRAAGTPGGVNAFNFSVEGNLLVYRALKTAQVTGAITRNTLTLPLQPAVTDTLALTGDVVQGDVITRLDRRFVIEGYVDTAQGRIRSTVNTHVQFTNTQNVWAQGLAFPDYRGYAQRLDLNSTVDRVSRRWRGDVLLSEDREHICYPLQLDKRATGELDLGDEIISINYDLLAIDLDQRRIKRGDQFRRGTARYLSNLVDRFEGSYDLSNAMPTPTRSSVRSYLFTDSRGTCYRARLTTLEGALASYQAGAGCPDGVNRVRWFAHPDGSPDALGWTSPIAP